MPPWCNIASQPKSVLLREMLHTALPQLTPLTDSSTDLRKGQWGEKRKRDWQEKHLEDKERDMEEAKGEGAH